MTRKSEPVSWMAAVVKHYPDEEEIGTDCEAPLQWVYGHNRSGGS